MSGTETNQIIQLPLQASQQADGVMVPSHVANDRPIDGAPAVVLHRLNETDIGQMIETDSVQKGILLAPAFQHLNRKGKRIGPVVDYFTAPKDTRFLALSWKLATFYSLNPFHNMAPYNIDIRRIADLEDVCGHRGILLPNDAAIYAAAKNDPAKLAMWHMPTLPLVNGRNMGSYQMNPNNMSAHRNRGMLQGTFTDTAGIYGAHTYWTASKHRTIPFCMGNVNLIDGEVSWDDHNKPVLSSRPVRAELRPAA